MGLAPHPGLGHEQDPAAGQKEATHQGMNRINQKDGLAGLEHCFP
jgi:hypothetical protein